MGGGGDAKHLELEFKVMRFGSQRDLVSRRYFDISYDLLFTDVALSPLTLLMFALLC